METPLKIEPSMDLTALADRMGGATEAEAYEMRELLMWDWYGKTADDVPYATWIVMLDKAAEQAA